MMQSMTTIMPIMFGFFSMTFSVGLSVYFVTSNLIGIVQYSPQGSQCPGQTLSQQEEG